jgi:hypothetical protein
VNREKHKDIHHLLKSIQQHSQIPITFDGEIPEFAFGEARQRLLVGMRYLVKDAQGHDRVGLLTTATVDEASRKAHCALTLESGEARIYTWPLSDAEMAAYNAHPETFFGEMSRSSKSDSPLDLYDFFVRGYEKTPKEKILEFFAQRPNLEELRKLSQPELVSMYAEHSVNFILAQQHAAAQRSPMQGAAGSQPAAPESEVLPK